jgi:hypothetical protein
VIKNQIKNRRKDNKTLSQKSKKGQKKNLTKDNKRKEPKIKILTHELLAFTLFYLMLSSDQGTPPRSSPTRQATQTTRRARCQQRESHVEELDCHNGHWGRAAVRLSGQSTWRGRTSRGRRRSPTSGQRLR